MILQAFAQRPARPPAPHRAKLSHVRNRIETLGAQLRLKLEHPTRFDRDRFVLSAANRQAAQRLDVWPERPGGALALIGPAGAGKSHLAAIWAERTRARALTLADLDHDRAGEVSGPALFDGADAAPHGEGFFHLLNRAERGACSLLLTGRTPPAIWPSEVADLRSRLNAAPVIELFAPDDELLRAVLVKLFRERDIRPSPELLAYLVSRIERSVPAAQAIVTALDETAAAEHRPVGRTLARALLKDEAEPLDEPPPV
jgi:chromosomal replication initiation ATPase DnaA